MGLGGGGSSGGNFDNVKVNPSLVQPNANPAAPTPMPGPTPVTGTGVTAGTGTSVYDQSAMDLNAARGAFNQTAGFTPDLMRGRNLGGYMSPYTNQVINRTTNDINRMRQRSLNDVGAQATSAGAFGGARHGLVEAETNKAAMQQIGDVSAQLRNQGWNNAQGAFFQDVANQMAGNQAAMGAGQGLAGLSQQGFNYGQAINESQMQQGAMQQALMQNLIDAGKGQFENWSNSPGQSLQYPLSAIGVSPVPSKSTTTKSPGLFDILGLGLSLI